MPTVPTLPSLPTLLGMLAIVAILPFTCLAYLPFTCHILLHAKFSILALYFLTIELDHVSNLLRTADQTTHAVWHCGYHPQRQR